MHPHQAFRWQERDAMRGFVRELGFGALFAATPDGPRVAHVPIVFDGDDAIAFHLSRGNGLARHLDGASALFTAFGPDAYVSPDWYQAGPENVPTWNYLAVELEGTVARLDRDGMLAQVDALTHEQEQRLAPKSEWTRDKMPPGHADRLLQGIWGFRMDIKAWRGTAKLGQTKEEAMRRNVADALEAQGRRAIAHWMRALP